MLQLANTTGTESQASVERSGAAQIPGPRAAGAPARRITFHISLKLLLVLLLAVGSAGRPGIAEGADTLDEGFIQPPDEAKPRVYWWWLKNLVDKEGITRDLQEFKAKGIAGVLLFSAGGGANRMPHGLEFMSPQWRRLVKHALRQADRLGLEVSINLCSGWDAGGPWITDETACQQYVQSELVLKGPRKFSGKLPQPPGSAKAYHDVAVQAFRGPASVPAKSIPRPRVTARSEAKGYPAANAIDGDGRTMWVSGGRKKGDALTPRRPEWLQLEYPRPVDAMILRIAPGDRKGPRSIEVRASSDGKSFATLGKYILKRHVDSVILLPTTRARILRIVITASHGAEHTRIAEISLLKPTKKTLQKALEIKGGRLSERNQFSVRAGIEAPLGPPPFAPGVQAIDPAGIVDLTKKLKPGGALAWDVPQGEWIVVRTGYTITGRKVSVSTRGGNGFELDWLNAGAMDLHFKSMAEVLLNDSAGLVGKCLKYLHDDSWEVGTPNWTHGFLDEFRKYRGYDARRYLPVLAGHVVGSAEISDRFLHDLRKTIADCLAENHYARFAELAHARGVKIHCEAGGPCWPDLVPMDALKNLGRCDIPMGEFWHSTHWHEEPNQNTCGKQTAAAAHIYGKRWVMAEAFTSMGTVHWMEGPTELKPTADIAFCEGINRFVLHTATSTRRRDGKPGYEYFAGTHFNPNITWWEQSGAWTAYIARCQWLLSRGLFVADVCYYNGDWAPNLVEPKHVDPALGKGYDYDVCNAEVLLTRMSVKDGRIVLPDGMSYRALALPDRTFMPVAILKKIKELVDAGATVVGPRPERAPGLRDYPGCDDRVRKLAGQLWGECDGKAVKERKAGKGRIVWGKSLRAVLTGSGTPPDFEYAGKKKDTFLDFIHRRDGDAEIYYVANRLDREESVRCTFRVSGKQPELWDPVTGSMRQAQAFTQADARTTVPLDFAPHGSLFVIFRKPIPADRNGTAGGNSPRLAELMELKGPWAVRFDPKWGGPANPVRFGKLTDWTKHADKGIKYYSGTARYTCESFDLPAASSNAAIYLDLGTARNVAEVKLNGKELGVLWARPLRVEITNAVKPKGNRLEIRVTNLWPNRIIGDADLPAEKRFTRTHITKSKYKKTGLLPSGLLGPVKILMEKKDK